MNKTIRIYVTASDIAAGEPCNPEACPIALALTRVVGEPVSVAETGWRQIGVKSWNRRPISARMLDFIHRFDAGGLVSPTVFRVPR